MSTISFPRRFDRDTLTGFFAELDQCQAEPEVRLDCSTLRYSFPTAMLVAGSKIRTWVSKRHKDGLTTRKAGYQTLRDVHSYLSHLGFFDYILMGEGNAVGAARGSSTYLPITRLNKPEFDADSSTTVWYDQIHSAVRGLARVVSGTVEDNEENRLYTYAFREIVRNAFEHSGADECYVCGQRWYNGKVEIAIVAEGVGVTGSLRQSFDIDTDVDALNLAIQPGKSRTTFTDTSENIYDNSGFGLYVLSEIAKSFGWYVFGSGESRIVNATGGYSVTEALKFKGTYFGMQIQNPPSQFSGLIKDIIAAGEDEAEASGIATKASGMSKFI